MDFQCSLWKSCNLFCNLFFFVFVWITKNLKTVTCIYILIQMTKLLPNCQFLEKINLSFEKGKKALSKAKALDAETIGRPAQQAVPYSIDNTQLIVYFSPIKLVSYPKCFEGKQYEFGATTTNQNCVQIHLATHFYTNTKQTKKYF